MVPTQHAGHIPGIESSIRIYPSLFISSSEAATGFPSLIILKMHPFCSSRCISCGIHADVVATSPWLCTQYWRWNYARADTGRSSLGRLFSVDIHAVEKSSSMNRTDVQGSTLQAFHRALHVWRSKVLSPATRCSSYTHIRYMDIEIRLLVGRICNHILCILVVPLHSL